MREKESRRQERKEGIRLSQAVDTVIFITISFLGKDLPLLAIMEGQIISKLVLSTIMVPPLILFFVRLGQRLDGGEKA